MHSFWKWLVVAGCGVGLVVAVDRLRDARADEDRGGYGRSADGDALRRLDRIVEKLDAIADRMAQGGHEGRPHPGRPPHARDGHPRDEQQGPPHDRPHPGRIRAEMPPEMREAMEKRMQEGRQWMQEGRERMEEVRKRMEQARDKFKEMEERILKLEAEVKALKTAP